jgi:hypothetical protein
LGAAQFL